MCRLMIGVILFAQFAISAYACPELSLSPAFIHASSDRFEAEPDSAACPMVMQSDAAVCAEHCKYGHNASNSVEASIVPCALPGARPALDEELQSPSFSLVAFESRPVPPAAASHAILHCSFRI